MQSIREFYENNADIPRHGQRHFLEVLSLLYFCTVKFNVGELTHTVNQIGYFFTKLRPYVFLRNTCVFDNIM